MNRQTRSFSPTISLDQNVIGMAAEKTALPEQLNTNPTQTVSFCLSLALKLIQSGTDLLQGMVMSAGLALPCYEGPGGELVVVEQADDHHHHHCHHHDDDDDLNKLQFSCTNTQKQREGG